MAKPTLDEIAAVIAHGHSFTDHAGPNGDGSFAKQGITTPGELQQFIVDTLTDPETIGMGTVGIQDPQSSMGRTVFYNPNTDAMIILNNRDSKGDFGTCYEAKPKRNKEGQVIVPPSDKWKNQVQKIRASNKPNKIPLAKTPEACVSLVDKFAKTIDMDKGLRNAFEAKLEAIGYEPPAAPEATAEVEPLTAEQQEEERLRLEEEELMAELEAEEERLKLEEEQLMAELEAEEAAQIQAGAAQMDAAESLPLEPWQEVFSQLPSEFPEEASLREETAVGYLIEAKENYEMARGFLDTSTPNEVGYQEAMIFAEKSLEVFEAVHDVLVKNDDMGQVTDFIAAHPVTPEVSADLTVGATGPAMTTSEGPAVSQPTQGGGGPGM